MLIGTLGQKSLAHQLVEDKLSKNSDSTKLFKFLRVISILRHLLQSKKIYNKKNVIITHTSETLRKRHTTFMPL